MEIEYIGMKHYILIFKIYFISTNSQVNNSTTATEDPINFSLVSLAIRFSFD